MNSKKSVMMVGQRMVGGDSRHIRLLGSELLKRDWNVCVVANWGTGHSIVPRSFFEKAGISTHSVAFPKLRPSPVVPVEALRASLEFNHLIAQQRPNIVHAHARSVLPFCYAVKGPPVVFTKHLTGGTGPLSSYAYRKARRVVAISTELRDELHTFCGVPHSRLRLIPHGIDPNFSEPRQRTKASLRRSLGLPEDGVILITVGRLDRGKDQTLILKAVAEIRNRIPAIHLVIVGDGPLRDEILHQLQRLDLGNIVTLTGQTSPLPYLDASDIFVLSSLHEGFALVVAEAMTRGLPTIRTSTGGATDQIEPGVTGLLFRPGDLQGLVAGVSALVDDPHLRANIAASAREHARSRFSAGRMAESTDRMYREIAHSVH